VVSDTENGTTVTEMGYVSPVLVQRFVDALEGQLGNTNSVDVAAQTSNVGSASGALDTTDPLAGTLASVINRLNSSAMAEDPGSSGLLQSFTNLMQGSGIGPDSADASRAASTDSSSSWLQSYLKNLVTPDTSTSGTPNISTTA
jgi:hypothetical protein